MRKGLVVTITLSVLHFAKSSHIAGFILLNMLLTDKWLTDWQCSLLTCKHNGSEHEYYPLEVMLTLAHVLHDGSKSDEIWGK